MEREQKFKAGDRVIFRNPDVPGEKDVGTVVGWDSEKSSRTVVSYPSYHNGKPCSSITECLTLLWGAREALNVILTGEPNGNNENMDTKTGICKDPGPEQRNEG